MENHLHGGVLLVDEDRVERVVVEHHVETLRTQVIVVRYLHREIGAEGGQTENQNGEENGLGSSRQESSEHEFGGLGNPEYLNDTSNAKLNQRILSKGRLNKKGCR